MLLPLIMPMFSLSAMLPFLMANIRDPLQRRLLAAMLLTTGVIGFSVLTVLVEHKDLLGFIASMCVAVVVVSMQIAQHYNPFLTDDRRQPKRITFQPSLHR